MNIVDELTEYFRKFPGVGPRQANRFVYYLLKQNPTVVNALGDKIKKLKEDVKTCPSCFQYHTLNTELCNVCVSNNRDVNKLLIVANDVDLKRIESSGTYNGLYFILGGIVPIMNQEPERIIRLSQLESKINEGGVTEVIIALNANPEGENTADLVRNRISNINPDIKVSMLGRGLSTGTEIEYSDPETLKNALKNRF